VHTNIQETGPRQCDDWQVVRVLSQNLSGNGPSQTYHGNTLQFLHELVDNCTNSRPKVKGCNLPKIKKN